jgi:hypothetical protein
MRRSAAPGDNARWRGPSPRRARCIRSATEESPNPTTNDREANGQFAKGNPGGPGNPYARQVAAMRLRALDRVSGDDVEAILSKMVTLAKEVDVPAARLVLQYTLGKPVASAHPDRLDSDEVEAFQANAMRQDAFSLVGSTPVEPVLLAVRELSPVKAEKFRDNLLANILAQNAKDAADAARATDSKRSKRPKSQPVSAGPTMAFAEAETLRLVNDPDCRAANDGLS